MPVRRNNTKIPLYQVDAFTSEVFKGNPAAVCILDEWLDDVGLQSIAAENNLSETAFLVKSDEGFEIRWFTPLVEVPLCGHATLASAFVIFNHLNWPEASVRIQTRQRGLLTVTQKEGLLEMDFPAMMPSTHEIPDGLDNALGHPPLEVLGTERQLLTVFADERTVRELKPDFGLLARYEFGTIVTAPGSQCDFVSRYFAPNVGIPEDPVTGSAHCVLVPYWSQRLGKKQLHARQVSKRGGELFCEDCGERVSIAGRAVLYLEGTIVV
ncbi:MAG TPA: PhzF family phenazine biosynthesis protein [Dehalococcoidia bacterium]|nr:PhzF family phenazine biosynthesis protein [Dehalococcoidia bacterium]